MIEGYVTKQEVVDMLLDLRNYAGIDAVCFRSEDAKLALNDVIGEIDLKLKELT
jgi:hypothetical protein